MISNKIELLAPACNIEIGRSAIDAGADAVYIGGPMFSARSAAGNSIEQIGELCRYAHLFGAKVYMALNTLLDADQIVAARDLIIQAHHVGVDAIIVQDMAVLNMNLPQEIELHASTQCAVRSAERVAELQRAGFSRVVLERGLSLAQVRDIRASSKVELEMFVHGAICISYSGECYLSERICARSANRGQCAQPCRSLYDLLDSRGQVLLRNEPLLSPKDLNLSHRLGEIVEAGVVSLKIEGRLKDECYVVGTVAHYDRELRRLGVQRVSYGVARADFEPDLEKSFSRGFTEYFFDGRRQGDVMTKNRVRGKFLGTISRVEANFFELDTGASHGLSNGDGVAYGGTDSGDRINRVDGVRLYPLDVRRSMVGIAVYGTSFAAYAPRSVRKISVSVELSEGTLTLCDEHDQRFAIALPSDIEVASNQEKARQTWSANLQKSGDTILSVERVTLPDCLLPFMPMGRINELRRELFALYHVPQGKPYIRPATDFRARNIVVSKADLTTPLCPLFQYGLCLKNKQLNLPLTLVNNGRRIRFTPRCERCELELTVE